MLYEELSVKAFRWIGMKSVVNVVSVVHLFHH